MRWLGTLAAVGIGWLALAGPADAVQLRGAMLTPNWSAKESVFGRTAEQQRAEIAAVAQMGGRVVKIHVDWARLQPQGIDPDYQARLDQAVSAAGQYRQAVILNITGTPCWAAKVPDCPVTHENHMNPPQPDAFGEISRYLLNRYPGLYAYEVWNEPDLYPFFHGTAADFVAFANAASAARDAVGSQTNVIVAGLLMGGSRYLDQLYQEGLHGQDGIALHPYSMSHLGWMDPKPFGSPFRESIESVHEVMLAHGDPGGIYLTELGFGVCPANTCLPATVAGRWLANSFRVAARYRYVKAVTVFSMTDYCDPADPNPGWQIRSGIMGRPAYGDIHLAWKQLRSKKYLRKHGYLGKKRKHKRKKT